MGLCEIGRGFSGGFEVKIEGNEHMHVSAISKGFKVEAAVADMFSRDETRREERGGRREEQSSRSRLQMTLIHRIHTRIQWLCWK